MEYSVRPTEYRPNERERRRERRRKREIEGERRMAVVGRCTRGWHEINQAREEYTFRVVCLGNTHLGFSEKKEGNKRILSSLTRLSSICPKARRVRGKCGDGNGSACCARRSSEHPLRVFTYVYVRVRVYARMNMCTGKTRRCSLTFAHTYVCT